MIRHRPLAIILLLTCALPANADVFVRDEIITDPTPDFFNVCHGNGCAELSEVRLSPAQWQDVRAAFAPPPANAAEERERVAQAIGLLERLTGVMVGTTDDQPGTFAGLGSPGQMDCIDESTNTTIYLRMLQKDGLLRHHTVDDRSTRGFFLFGWPHTSAVMRESASNRLYAVDSWFGRNGDSAYVVPLDEWIRGWRPAKQAPYAGSD